MSGPVLFGVRHLSPAAAFHLSRALDEAQPQLVLVEGPSDLNDQMQWLCHPQTVLPAALLAYTKEAPVRTILYPFACYSPEYQAIRWAFAHNVPCRFMDLPSGAFLAMAEPAEPEQPPAEPGRTTENVYQKLEELTGEDHDSFWERRFEQLADAESYRAACTAFGRELRASASDSPYRTAETLVREAFMKRTIQEAVDSGIPAERIFCVCGAFHVAGLEENCPMTDEELQRLPLAECAATLMPYSYYRLSTRSGYGAGNRAPAYFELLWDALRAGDLSQTAYLYLTKLAAAQRKAGNPLSPAEVIEAVRLSETLCAMRGSRFPCLRDLRDAAVATMGHGRFSELSIAAADTEIGTKVGFLPEGVSRTSVQDDFYRQLKGLRLEKYRVPQSQPLELDLREKLTVRSEDAAFLDLHRSFFLHRLRVLHIRFAQPVASRQEKASWGEYWSLCWTPECEIEVAESSLLGDTLAGAAAFALKERAERSASLSEAASIFQDAFLCGIPEAAQHALSALQALAADAAALTEMASALQQLSLTVRYGDLRRFDCAPVVPLMEQLYLRACLSLESACVCDAQAAADVTAAMDRVNAVQLCHDFLPGESWTALLTRISDRDDLNTRCSGFAMATLLERGEADEETLSREVSRRLSPGIPADLGAGWFEGLAGKNRYALIARLSLWRQLDEYLSQLDEPAFRRALVSLRRAFADFSPFEKSDIAENLGELWGAGAPAAEQLMQESTPDEQAVLDGLKEFDFDDI